MFFMILIPDDVGEIIIEKKTSTFYPNSVSSFKRNKNKII